MVADNKGTMVMVVCGAELAWLCAVKGNEGTMVIQLWLNSGSGGDDEGTVVSQQ
ncbi:bisdemethoxycurcumin synthase [Sesbania bispinosa]|nr:bisdemethoxycurcumin synthase [Sesbania bispinosa]